MVNCLFFYIPSTLLQLFHLLKAFELAAPVKTCSVNIAWNKGDERIYDFTISTSVDGQSFTDNYSRKSTGKSLSYETYDLGNSQSDIKFLKITLTGSSSKAGWVGIRDLSVVGR
jgi:hypothetical protein